MPDRPARLCLFWTERFIGFWNVIAVTRPRKKWGYNSGSLRYSSGAVPLNAGMVEPELCHSGALLASSDYELSSGDGDKALQLVRSGSL